MLKDANYDYHSTKYFLEYGLKFHTELWDKTGLEISALSAAITSWADTPSNLSDYAEGKDNVSLGFADVAIKQTAGSGLYVDSLISRAFYVVTPDNKHRLLEEMCNGEINNFSDINKYFKHLDDNYVDQGIGGFRIDSSDMSFCFMALANRLGIANIEQGKGLLEKDVDLQNTDFDKLREKAEKGDFKIEFDTDFLKKMVGAMLSFGENGSPMNMFFVKAPSAKEFKEGKANKIVHKNLDKEIEFCRSKYGFPAPKIFEGKSKPSESRVVVESEALEEPSTSLTMSVPPSAKELSVKELFELVKNNIKPIKQPTSLSISNVTHEIGDKLVGAIKKLCGEEKMAVNYLRETTSKRGGTVGGTISVFGDKAETLATKLANELDINFPGSSDYKTEKGVA